MKFADLDPILVSWSRENNLALVTEDDGEEVRQWILLDPGEWEYHLSVYINGDELSISAVDFYVHALDYPGVDPGHLKQELSKALAEVRSWMDENMETLKRQKGSQGS